ncbi:TIGR04283 family arsenosugar biosynthesis glycosyltransferase [Lentiprolixibacter aurantiacus]|uniref:TIGR04283 family arsenosugar biosynthesis glycosyltransferase n=1 Tax=Lentiprolixibacter aurantiacus TaxID=2993939 RepID=A0AAE3SM30_9FLAO|nr:TIGR04283 family arsenosugar biosynthesis glycosyltransferase [Lentiprolixibacter aurantiacus]MCX2718139.1 TIGR04283 family arsenosugar biosynthesis glycosyltransferase [Lentiprolixibacter aurantiacus]
MHSNQPQISVIIPVLNEEDLVITQHRAIKEASTTNRPLEIIYVDGGSTDQTIVKTKELQARLLHSDRGRAKQMNLGAEEARGDILYFLHADTLPPKGFDQSIIDAADNGVKAGSFRMKFDSNSTFLRFFAWFTRFNHWLCRGGDQSIFISKDYFKTSGGFDEDYMIYEDLEFIKRLYRQGLFKVLPDYVVTSARKYNQLGKYRLQYHFAVIHLKNYLGKSPEEIYDYYKRYIQS